MANLSNINNKFLVTTGGNVLIGQTSAVGSSIFQVTGASTLGSDVTMANGNVHIHQTGADYLTYIDFLRSSANANPTARIHVIEPAATHTSRMEFYTSDASGSAPNLRRAMFLDQNLKAYFDGTIETVGNVTVGSDLIIPEYIYHTGNLTTFFGFPSDNTFKIKTNDSDALTIDSSQDATFAGIVGMGSTGIYAGTGAQLNLPGRGLAIKNDKNGSNNNWSFIENTAEGSEANLNFHTGNNVAALTLSHIGDATFARDVTIKNSAVAKLKAAPLGSTYGSGFNVMTVTGTSSSPFTSTIGFSNYNATDAMVIKGKNVGIGTTSPNQSNLVVSPAAQSANVDGITVVYNPDGATNRVRGQLRIDDFVGVLELTNSSDVISTKINAEGDSYFSGGDVGIGKTNPELKLDVESATDADLVALKSTANSNNTQMRFGINGNDSVISATGGSTGALVFKTYGSEAMRLTQGGTAEISGAVRPLLLRKPSGTTDDFYIVADNFTQNKFLVAGTGQIYSTFTSITSLSDITLKENIKPLETGLSEIMQLKPRRFDWKDDDRKNVAGFIAQELEEVLPDLVGDYQYNKEQTKKSVAITDIIPTLVKAIQELKAEVDLLKNK